MVPRDTKTGAVLEQMVLPALRKGGYEVESQVPVGQRLGGGRHYVDAVASDAQGRSILVSMKWQQVGGTAEQKVAFEVMCLAHALRDSGGAYGRAYIVLGGEGWKLREFYVKGGLDEYLLPGHGVSIVTLEQFVMLANSGKL